MVRIDIVVEPCDDDDDDGGGGESIVIIITNGPKDELNYCLMKGAEFN